MNISAHAVIGLDSHTIFKYKRHHKRVT